MSAPPFIADPEAEKSERTEAEIRLRKLVEEVEFYLGAVDWEWDRSVADDLKRELDRSALFIAPWRWS